MFNNQNKKVNFSIFEKDNTSYVSMNHTDALGSSEKTILLPDFLKFMSDFNNDKTLTDTGFVIPNLIRKVTKGTRELCFYHFPELAVSPFTRKSNIRSSSTIEQMIMNIPEGQNTPFRLHYDRYMDERRDENINVVKLDNFKLRNIILVTFYDKANSGNIISYNVFHSLKTDSVFEDSTSNLIDDNTLLFPSIMPNHYSDKICWGSTGFESRLRGYFSHDNYDGIKTIPTIYFNSFFNDDLISSNYGTNFPYRISSDLFNKICRYYADKHSNPEFNYDEIKRQMVSSLASNGLENRGSYYNLDYTCSSLILVMGPIFTDPSLYNQYFSELKTYCDSNSYRNSITSISSYIQSRLSL